MRRIYTCVSILKNKNEQSIFFQPLKDDFHQVGVDFGRVGRKMRRNAEKLRHERHDQDQTAKKRIVGRNQGNLPIFHHFQNGLSATEFVEKTTIRDVLFTRSHFLCLVWLSVFFCILFHDVIAFLSHKFWMEIVTVFVLIFSICLRFFVALKPGYDIDICRNMMHWSWGPAHKWPGKFWKLAKIWKWWRELVPESTI